MTRDEIISLAREAGFYDGREELFWVGAEGLERFAALVSAKERETISGHYGAQPYVEFFGSELADEIRDRSQ